MQAIGNTAQGFIDAVIFVAFTEQVRRKMISGFCRWLRPKQHSLLINTDIKPTINSYRACRYQPEQPVVNSGGFDDPTSATSCHVSNYNNDFEYEEEEYDD